MGFHPNKVVFVSINVELLTLKVCFMFQNYFCHILQPAGAGRSLLLLFFNFFIFNFFFCSYQLLMTLKNNVFCIFCSVIGQYLKLLATVKSFPTQLLLSVNACMLSTCAWNLSRMLGYQELKNACDVVMNPTVCC